MIFSTDTKSTVLFKYKFHLSRLITEFPSLGTDFKIKIKISLNLFI